MRARGEARVWGGSHEIGALGFNSCGLGKIRPFGGIEGRGLSIVENTNCVMPPRMDMVC